MFGVNRSPGKMRLSDLDAELLVPPAPGLPRSSSLNDLNSAGAGESPGGDGESPDDDVIRAAAAAAREGRRRKRKNVSRSRHVCV